MHADINYTYILNALKRTEEKRRQEKRTEEKRREEERRGEKAWSLMAGRI